MLVAWLRTMSSTQQWVYTQTQKSSVVPQWRQGDGETLREVMVAEKAFGCCVKVRMCECL